MVGRPCRLLKCGNRSFVCGDRYTSSRYDDERMKWLVSFPDRTVLMIGVLGIVFLTGAVTYRYATRQPLTPEGALTIRLLDERLAQASNQLDELIVKMGQLDTERQAAALEATSLHTQATQLGEAATQVEQLGKAIRKHRVRRSAFAAANQATTAADKALTAATLAQQYMVDTSQQTDPKVVIASLEDARSALDAADAALEPVVTELE